MHMTRSVAASQGLAGLVQEARRLAAAVSFIAAALLLFTAPPARAATGLPFQSSFETGNFSEWNGGGEATMSVVSGQSTHGQYSAQSVMIPGQATDNYKDYVFGNHPWVGGQAVNASAGLWLEFDVKFDAGFVFPNCECTHKIAIVNFEDENARRRYQIIINVWASRRVYMLEHLKWNADRSFGGSLTGLVQNVGPEITPRIGQWDKLKLYIRPNTPGAADGIVRFWVNGVLKAEHTAVAVRENTSFLPNKLIMSNYVTNTTTAGTQRWDNFYLGETDRGTPAPLTPRAPVLNEVR